MTENDLLAMLVGVGLGTIIFGILFLGFILIKEWIKDNYS